MPLFYIPGMIVVRK